MVKNLAAETVLFVDDEKNILNALKRELMDEEYQCLFALSGNQALQIMKTEQVSVIISDMKMPDMDGLRLLKLVKEKYPSTVRIVLSGYTQLPQILVTVNQAEIFKFLTKPWGSELKSVIMEAINYHQMQKDRAVIEQLLNLQLDDSTGILDKLENIIGAVKSVRKIYAAIGNNAFEIAIRALENPDEHDTIKQQLIMANSMLLDLSQTDYEEYRQILVGSYLKKLGDALTGGHIRSVNIEPSEALSATVRTLPRMLSRFMIKAVRTLTDFRYDFSIELRANIIPAGEARNLELTCLISPDGETDMPEDGYDEQQAYVEMLNEYVSKILSQLGGGFQGLIAKGVMIMKTSIKDERN